MGRLMFTSNHRDSPCITLRHDSRDAIVGVRENKSRAPRSSGEIGSGVWIARERQPCGSGIRLRSFGM